MSASKNTELNALPQFIWGEAVSESGFTPQDFLTQTKYPRFICRVYEGENVTTEMVSFKSDVSHHEKYGLIYTTSLDVHFKDFVFLDKGGFPVDEDLKNVCDLAILNYQMRDDEYEINDQN